MHGGAVHAESPGAGRGSAFVVELPMAQQGRRSEPVKTLKATVPSSSNRRRVLVVDDNEDAAEMLAGALAQIGYDVAIAHDGPSALERAARLIPMWRCSILVCRSSTAMSWRSVCGCKPAGTAISH